MIFINDIPSLRDPESNKYFYDQRIEKIELINGTTAQNSGHVKSGDYWKISAVFYKADIKKLEMLVAQDLRVSFTDEAGDVHESLRLVLKDSSPIKKYPRCKVLNFELWRC